TSRQPSATSCKKRWRMAGTCAATRVAVTKATLNRKLAASTAKHQPAPAAATIAAETTGPKMFVALRDIESSAFAFCRFPALTACGRRAVHAGVKKPAHTPAE